MTTRCSRAWMAFVCLLPAAAAAQGAQPLDPAAAPSPGSSPEGLKAASADEPAPQGQAESDGEAAPAQGASPVPLEVEAQLESLHARLLALEEDKRALEERLQAAETRRPEAPHLVLADGVRLRPRGYVDVGLFATLGDGVAYVRDVDGAQARELTSFPWLLPYPERPPPDPSSAPWVFFGDPWANAVNAQGESADLGLDRTNIARFDPIRSGGRPTFLVNLVNLGAVATIGRDLLFEASVNLAPRDGALGAPGDFFDVDLAYLEWTPLQELDVSLFVGKLEPVFGREYRARQAPDRYGVTPSLVARYTVGTPLGLKARGTHFDERVTWAFSLTNQGAATEHFGHFHDEVDGAFLKTASGRLSLGTPFFLLLPMSLEIGVSGQGGPQDGQRRDDVLSWQAGIDGKLVLGPVTLLGEWLRFVAPGDGTKETAKLEAEGGYLELQAQVLPWLGLLARGDIRRALLTSYPNLYVSDVARGALGARLDLSWNVIAKLEYLRLQELTGPEIDDDVFTSSLVLRF